MKWEIEVLSPSYVHHNNNNSYHWLLGDSNSNNNNNRSTKWTPVENKLFENALALHDKDTPDRWLRVAEMIPGKSVMDVMNQYKELEADVFNIEAGLVPVPGYSTSTSTSTSTTTTTSPFTLDWVSGSGFDGFKGVSAKRSSSRTPEQERKKGVPWTEEEHKLFLLGLNKYGKGDWRNISRNFVISRTPTQVASHAQKYFIRQLSGGKDKRRASIHDITAVNITDNRTSPSEDNKRSNSPHHRSMMLSHQHQPNSTASNNTSLAHFKWNNKLNSGVAMTFSRANDEVFMSPSFGVNSYGLKMQGQNLHKSALHESSNYLGHQTQNIAFQMQPSQHYSNA